VRYCVTLDTYGAPDSALDVKINAWNDTSLIDRTPTSERYCSDTKDTPATHPEDLTSYEENWTGARNGFAMRPLGVSEPNPAITYNVHTAFTDSSLDAHGEQAAVIVG